MRISAPPPTSPPNHTRTYTRTPTQGAGWLYDIVGAGRSPPHPHPNRHPTRHPANRRCLSQELADTWWALASLGHGCSRGFMDELLASAEAQLPRFKSQQLATLTWALATAGHNWWEGVWVGWR